MDNKNKAAVLIIIVLAALLALFALVGAAVRNDEDDLLAYLPVILHVTGTPPPTATSEPSNATNTPKPTKTPTPTPTATPIPRHFDDCAFRTGNNATVAVTANITINGDLVLAVDDEIAVFTPDGSICAGMTPWSGQNIAITAWGDDSQTEAVDGLRDGETMAYRIWDNSENEEILVKEVTYALGNGIYATDGIYAVSSFTLE